MPTGFMASDIAAVSLAFVLFSLFGFVPGYVLGWGLDLLGFRSRSFGPRLVISTPVSAAAFPVLTYLLWHWSVNAVWLLYSSCWIAFCAVIFHRWTRPTVSRRMVLLCAIVFGWVVVGMFCLIDLQIEDRLYFPTVSYDYQLRTAITSSITRSGIPPDNPYFFTGQPFALRYHYFWLIPCSLVDQIGGSFVTARHALIAATLWCGIGLIAMVPLYLRFFQPKGSVDLERRTLCGVALLGVTGLDIVPVTMTNLWTGSPMQTIEWWNNQITAWVTSALWVGHALAGLIACLTGFLVIYHSFRCEAGRQTLAVVVSGVMFASAAGLSIYVAFAFAATLAVLTVVLLSRRYRLEPLLLVASGVVALVVAAPYLLFLYGSSGGVTGTGSPGVTSPPVEFTIRSFMFPERVVRILWPDQRWLTPLTNLLLLPLNYFLELGFFLVVGVVTFKRLQRTARLDIADLCAVTMALISILLCTFLRSSVIASNDLGWRGFLVVQFILLIWAAELWNEGYFTTHVKRASILALFSLGVAGTAYEVAMVRFYTLISDEFAIRRDTWFPADHHLGERTYALRRLYEQLQERLPSKAVVQHNPNQSPGDVFHGLYADRQAAVETPGCGVVFGGDAHRCNEVMPSISGIFNGGDASEWRQVEARCGRLSIAVLVAKDTDPVWKDQGSWVWTRQPLVANGRARAVPCKSDVDTPSE